MRITTVRRASQGFFLLLMLFLSVVSSPGEGFWRATGWPVSWFVELDPLSALKNVLSTGTLPSGLIWASLTALGTVLLGRAFCGWVCPLGTLQHLVGHLGSKGLPVSKRIARNAFHEAQSTRLVVLLVVLAAASGSLLAVLLSRSRLGTVTTVLSGVLFATAILWALRRSPLRRWTVFLAALAGWLALVALPGVRDLFTSSVALDLLDPIPLVQRSLDLVLLPWLDRGVNFAHDTPRTYALGGLTFVVFLAVVGISALHPRAFCRYLCPLGALLGVTGRFALWRIGRTSPTCRSCGRCETACEGACSPSTVLRPTSCVLCLNCLHVCPDDVLRFGPATSFEPGSAEPEPGRRTALGALGGGLALVPALRLSGTTGSRWSSDLVRPPGALKESAFLSRCVACGKCMRSCPTNVLQPAGLTGGVETLWTPALDFRAGSSGCQPHCVACGEVCPTGAIRSLSLDEKLGTGDFAAHGPLRIGTAFVDRGRCLPWAMDRPCIVCQEVCPTSPKAIVTRPRFVTLRGGVVGGTWVGPDRLRLAEKPQEDLPSIPTLTVRPQGSEDAFALSAAGCWDVEIALAADDAWRERLARSGLVEVQRRVDTPQVDPGLCIGCGICEHECPLSGARAIRVTAEGESREPRHAFLVSRSRP